MFSIKSYDDILSINRDLAILFCCPEDAVSLLVALNGVVQEWVEKHNKQYWEVVRFVCERRGLLGKKTKSKPNKLTREAFAEILVIFCDSLRKKETRKTLKASMEKYKFCAELSMFDKLPEAHLARKDVQDVENLLDQRPVEVSPVKAAPTLKDIVYEYLKEVETIQAKGYPRMVVRQRPNYNDIRPAVSVETYMSEKMYDEGTPSRIDAYEVVEGILDMKKLNELIGQYSSCCRNMVKLFIVSTAGIYPDVRSKAESQYIGYVRLNPYLPMTSGSYELPRKVNALELWRQLDDKLMLKDDMDIPLLIMDGGRRETSFSYLYEQWGKGKNISQLIYIPFLPKEIIENKAKEFTDSYEANLRSMNLLDENMQMAINPFVVADEIGLKYEWNPMPDDILGVFDARTGYVTLNVKYWQQTYRMRFTMSHEIGHYLFHASCFKDSNIISLDETEETLKEGFWMNGEAIKRADYQANLFASYLLMPTLTTATLYAYYDGMFTGREPGFIYYNALQPETWPRYQFVIGRIAHRLQVSMKVAAYRLMGMNFLKKS